MTSAIAELQDRKGPLKGWHVLLWMIGFFGLMFVVNGFFLFYAITTFPGEDVKKSYAQGLEYNHTLAERAQQAQLGWRAEMGLIGSQLEIRLLDGSGAGVSGYDVEVQVRRLATTSADTVLPAGAQGGGIYLADVAQLAAGQWDVTAKVKHPNQDGTVFEAHKRINIR
jgi:nitrogen fixation protein FixH